MEKFLKLIGLDGYNKIEYIMKEIKDNEIDPLFRAKMEINWKEILNAVNLLTLSEKDDSYAFIHASILSTLTKLNIELKKTESEPQILTYLETEETSDYFYLDRAKQELFEIDLQSPLLPYVKTDLYSLHMENFEPDKTAKLIGNVIRVSTSNDLDKPIVLNEVIAKLKENAHRIYLCYDVVLSIEKKPLLLIARDCHDQLKKEPLKSSELTKASPKIEIKPEELDQPVSEETTPPYTIIKKIHEKKGTDIWLVKLRDRLGKEDYRKLEKTMKNFGGYYSSYSTARGFVFDHDPSEEMKQINWTDFSVKGSRMILAKESDRKPAKKKDFDPIPKGTINDLHGQTEYSGANYNKNDEIHAKEMAEMTRNFIKNAKEQGLIPYEMKFSITIERSRIKIILKEVPIFYKVFRDSYYEYYAQSGRRPFGIEDMNDPSFMNEQHESGFLINNPNSLYRFSDPLLKIMKGIEAYVDSYRHSVHYNDMEGGGYENFDFDLTVDSMNNPLLDDALFLIEKEVSYFLQRNLMDDLKTMIYWYFHYVDPSNNTSNAFLRQITIRSKNNPILTNENLLKLIEVWVKENTSLYDVLDKLCEIINIQTVLGLLYTQGSHILSMLDVDFRKGEILALENKYNPPKIKVYIHPFDIKMTFKFDSFPSYEIKTQWRQINEIYENGCKKAQAIYLQNLIDSPIRFRVNTIKTWNMDLVEIEIHKSPDFKLVFLYVIWNKATQKIRFVIYRPIENESFEDEVECGDMNCLASMITKIESYYPHLNQEEMDKIEKEILDYGKSHFRK